jgi:hypothetical protein
MSRTARHKIVYFLLVGTPVLFVFTLLYFFSVPSQYGIVAVLLCLVPGRILGWFWRDLLRGLRLLRERRYEESIQHSQAFLEELDRRPWIRHFIWLGSGVYSRDPRALALNNLGAAEVALGRLDEAQAHLHSSIAVDRENPLPYFNLSRLAKARGDETGAALFLQQARQHGLTFGVTDKIVMDSQKRFANRSGT